MATALPIRSAASAIPDLRGAVEGLIEAAAAQAARPDAQLEDGPQPVKLDGAKLLMVLLHMMREGEAA